MNKILLLVLIISLSSYTNGERIFHRKRAFVQHLIHQHQMISNVRRGGGSDVNAVESDVESNVEYEKDMDDNDDDDDNSQKDTSTIENEENEDLERNEERELPNSQNPSMMEVLTQDETIAMSDDDDDDDGDSQEQISEDDHHEMDHIPLTGNSQGFHEENSDIDFSDSTTTTTTTATTTSSTDESCFQDDEEQQDSGRNMEKSMDFQGMDFQVDVPSSSMKGQETIIDDMDDVDVYDVSTTTIHEKDSSILNHNHVNDVDPNIVMYYDDMEADKCEEEAKEDKDLHEDTRNDDEVNPNQIHHVETNEDGGTRHSNLNHGGKDHQEEHELDGEEGREQDYPLNDVVIDQDMHEDISAEMADVETDFTTVVMTDVDDAEEIDDEDEMKTLSTGYIETDFQSEGDSTGTCDRMDFADAYDDDDHDNDEEEKEDVSAMKKDESIKDSNVIQESEAASNNQLDPSSKAENEDNQLNSEDTRRLLRTLSYSEAEVAVIKPSVATVIANKMFKRPKTGIPPEFCMEGEPLPVTSTNKVHPQWRIFSPFQFEKDTLKKVFAPAIATSLFIIGLTTSFSSQKKSKSDSSNTNVSTKVHRIVTPIDTTTTDQPNITDQDETRNDDYLRRRYI